MPRSIRSDLCRKRSEVIKALAHPTRILIAEALGEEDMSVRDITELVGADISTVSKHLSVMRQVGLVESEKLGLQRIYRLVCPCLGEFFQCVDRIAGE